MAYKALDYDFNNSICMDKIEFTRFVRVNKLIEFVHKEYEQYVTHPELITTYFTIYNGVAIICEEGEENDS